ncbi:MAG: dihydrolipoyl dehydrogenase [Acidobacteria bacterium RIFCSPLOWO2_12_FULL_65_11]|nr:MAG: dihydrolipoyl dehydrogenase [Acidobacteria bacterium RIFCSPLOWO2_02_FULL_64_15]OFW29469.1 MAG: dihydrolipoyl dehydrogenase [Acidobacteria bacterium RIFCSPLOWO2_12_FULL_65_11]
MTSTQLVVVGGGPGGYAAAFLAADLGLRVVLVDPEANPGGVCVYRGCIPSKALLHVANLVSESRHAKAWGIEFGEPRIDLAKLRDFKNGVVSRLTTGTGQLVKHRKVQYLQGFAEIVDAHSLTVKLTAGSEEQVQFEHAILATGSGPAIPGPLKLPGDNDPRVMDSTTALDLPDIPKSLLVVGGGYIGLELGTVYAALGSAVTVVEMTPGLLPGADRDLVDVLAKRITRTFKTVLLETRVVQMAAEAKGIRVGFEGKADQKDEVFDRVLVAVGRRPNSGIPGLGRTRVRVDERGFIVVDEQRRTHEPSIFAIGDVAGEPMLAHKASHEGRVAVEVIVGEDVAFAPRAIPAVVFTDPELAWAGLTEAQAAKESRAIAVAKFPWGASGRAITLDRTDGLTKLVIDPDTERLLGVGLVGPGAGELIAEGVLAIEMGATATDLKLSIHPHPTLTETLMESAEVFFGQATHVYRPRRQKEKAQK